MKYFKINYHYFLEKSLILTRAWMNMRLCYSIDDILNTKWTLREQYIDSLGNFGPIHPQSGSKFGVACSLSKVLRVPNISGWKVHMFCQKWQNLLQKWLFKVRDNFLLKGKLPQYENLLNRSSITYWKIKIFYIN